MRRLILLICFYSFVTIKVNAQSSPPRTTSFAKPVAANANEYAKQNLLWIKTGNDFDQNTLNAEAIDQEIERRIKEYDLETAVITYDVPINSKRLTKPNGKSSYGNYNSNIQSALYAAPQI
ncbi:hypothetical protein Q0590_23070 [Rhodocytophaga aerolata]|uniref:Uncharacterized protein n=1 Tax=Rhodocytophaga aerolata TaxID=455078 RepID=A0ABT8RAP4_9BACT|nr:hypothetical protein [Rhodocytophaga aerolata]MDO1449177.1 hypothetical protein [Rhodocytophaga aerolata]